MTEVKIEAGHEIKAQDIRCMTDWINGSPGHDECVHSDACVAELA